MFMMEYIIKSSTAIALTYMLYYVFARKLTNFKYIRGYFYLSVGISLIFPCFSDFISLFDKGNTTIAPEFLTTIVSRPFINSISEAIGSTTGVVINERGISPLFNLDFLKSIYFLGVAFLFLRFIVGMFRIFRMIIKYPIM